MIFRWALMYGVEPVVFEENDDLGGLWKYRAEGNELNEYMGWGHKTSTRHFRISFFYFSNTPPPSPFPFSQEWEKIGISPLFF